MLLGSVMQLLWNNEVTDDERSHRMRFMWGTPLPINHDEWEQRFNLRLARGGGYGSTDAGSVALPLWDKTGAGKVLPRYEVAIFDTEDQLLPAGQAGELVIREVEPGVMATGYLGQPEITAETWRDGWFRTGDLCRLDEVGDVYWLSRLKERIRVKGEMVSAYEIEEVVLNHQRWLIAAFWVCQMARVKRRFMWPLSSRMASTVWPFTIWSRFVQGG